MQTDNQAGKQASPFPGKWKGWLRGRQSVLPRGQKAAVLLTTGLTLVVLVLRVVITPLMQDVETGRFELSFVVIGVMIAALIAAGVLIFLSGSSSAFVRVRGPLLGPVALFAALTGAVMFVVSAVDAIRWAAFGDTPAPNATVISTVDALTLFFTILFGLVGGAFLTRLGLLWLAEGGSRSGIMRLWALAPVGWTWMRLARYEVSYASAVDVSESFYDFIMLIFTLLFFFAFARYVSGIGGGRHRLLLFYALGTALFSLTGPLTSVFFYMTGQFDAYNLSHLASPTDWFVGAFALLFAYSLVFSRGSTQEPVLPEDKAPPADRATPMHAAPPADEAVLGEPEDTSSSVEDILREFHYFSSAEDREPRS